jgi:hypothetical protein
MGATSASKSITRTKPCQLNRFTPMIDTPDTKNRCQRGFALAATLALILAVPGTANSFTLEQLLDIPIEQLLQLEITSTHLPQLAVQSSQPPNRVRAAEHSDAT